MTADQIHLLRRYTKRVTMVYDGDYAGELATLRGLDLLLGEGMQVRIVGLPPGEDPDSAARRLGAEGFRQLLAHAQDLFTYKLGLLRRRYDSSTVEGKVAICEQLLPTIKRVPNATQASEYVRMLAEGLKVREADVRLEIGRVRLDGDRPWRPSALTEPPRPGAAMERVLLGIVLEDPRYLLRMGEQLALDHVQDAAVRQALTTLLQQPGGDDGALQQAIAHLKHGDSSSLIAQALVFRESLENVERAFEECLRRIREEHRRRQLGALQQRIQAAEQDGDDAAAASLITEVNQLVRTKG